MTCVRAIFQLQGCSLRLPQEMQFAVPSLTFTKAAWQKCCLFPGSWLDDMSAVAMEASSAGQSPYTFCHAKTACSDKQHVKLLFLPSLSWHKPANVWAAERLSVSQLHSQTFSSAYRCPKTEKIWDLAMRKRHRDEVKHASEQWPQCDSISLETIK